MFINTTIMAAGPALRTFSKYIHSRKANVSPSRSVRTTPHLRTPILHECGLRFCSTSVSSLPLPPEHHGESEIIFPDSTRLFINDYANAISNGNAAVFIGAGLSCGAGLVDWRGLLMPYAQNLGLNIDRQNFLELAQRYCDRDPNGRNDINQSIQAHFDRSWREGDIPESHQILAHLPIQSYWTTNYDQLIETALNYRQRSVDTRVFSKDFTKNIKKDAVVYKMHGDVKFPETCIITEKDYQAYSCTRDLFTRDLQVSLASKTFLFLGFSFQDPNLLHILGTLPTLLGNDLKNHFYLSKPPSVGMISNTSSEKDKMLDLESKYNLTPVHINEYPEIPQILSEIKKAHEGSRIFISGGTRIFGGYDEMRAKEFLSRLSYKLTISGRSLTVGNSRGVSHAIKTGAYDKDQVESHDIPFIKLENEDNAAFLERKEAVRRDVVPNQGVAIFVFGGDDDSKNNGTIKEFDIALQKGLSVIPIGATNEVSRKLWQHVKDNLFDFYKEKTKDIAPFFQILGEEAIENDKEVNEKILNAIVKMVEILLPENPKKS